MYRDQALQLMKIRLVNYIQKQRIHIQAKHVAIQFWSKEHQYNQVCLFVYQNILDGQFRTL